MNIFKIHRSPLFIRVVFVVAVFMMLLVSALTYRHVESINLSSDSVEHTYKVSIEIEDMYSNIKDLEITNTVLSDIFKEQQNLVHLNLNSNKKTLLFTNTETNQKLKYK